MGMFAAEVLSQLRTLNWLAGEVRRVPPESREGVLLREQIEAVRARLPHAILVHHDRLSEGGGVSAAAVAGDHCGACRGNLPEGLMLDLQQPGHFGVCPHCGVFLWLGEQAGEGVAPLPAGDDDRTRRGG